MDVTIPVFLGQEERRDFTAHRFGWDDIIQLLWNACRAVIGLDEITAAADVSIVGMPAASDFDIPVPGTAPGKELQDAAIMAAAAKILTENRQPRNIRLRDREMNGYIDNEPFFDIIAEERRNAQALQVIGQRHVETMGAAETTPTETRQPRNIRLRDRDER